MGPDFETWSAARVALGWLGDRQLGRAARAHLRRLQPPDAGEGDSSSAGCGS